MPETLEETIIRLAGNKLSEIEIQQLAAAIVTGQATLAMGDEAVASGGNVIDTTIPADIQQDNFGLEMPPLNQNRVKHGRNPKL